MLAAHLTKCCLTLVSRLKHSSHRKQQNCLYSECTSSEWVSSFLTAHQHIIGYTVPYNGLENAIKDGKYNQGYQGRWDFSSASVQKRFGQWMQTYGFTALCLHTCLKVTTAAELLLTNVTGQPRTFIVWLLQMSWVGQAFQNTLNSVHMSTALHQCEYEHDASVHFLS